MSDDATSVQLPLASIPDGGTVRCVVGGREVAVFRKGTEVYAVDALCPHRRGPLDTDGIADSYVIVCPWHGWAYDVRTGLSPFSPGRLRCFSVRCEDDMVTIGPPE